MYPSQFRQLTSVVALLIALGLSSVNPAPAQAQSGPDFSNVDDILNGTRYLLRIDDIVFGYQGAFGLFTSQDSTLTRSNDMLFSLNDGTNRYSQPAVVGARLFNTASDVAVTLVYDRDNVRLHWQLDSFASTVASSSVPLSVAGFWSRWSMPDVSGRQPQTPARAGTSNGPRVCGARPVSRARGRSGRAWSRIAARPAPTRSNRPRRRTGSAASSWRWQCARSGGGHPR